MERQSKSIVLEGSPPADEGRPSSWWERGVAAEPVLPHPASSTQTPATVTRTGYRRAASVLGQVAQAGYVAPDLNLRGTRYRMVQALLGTRSFCRRPSAGLPWDRNFGSSPGHAGAHSLCFLKVLARLQDLERASELDIVDST